MSQQQISQYTKTERSHTGLYYEYDALPDEQSSRYLVLQPGSSYGESLVCTLHTAHLHDFPRYEVISYVWGASVKDKSVTCNGKIIHIATNLSHALLQVRATDEPRTLWVDSICINQANDEEQAHQVSLMSQIYKQSHSTLICLGFSDHVHAHIAADLVAEVDRMIQGVFKRVNFNWKANSFPFPEEGEPLLSHRGWKSFGILLQQPWFTRGWVVQEAILSQRAIVLWATTEIDWLKLVRAYIWRTRRALKLPSVLLRLSNLHLQGVYGRQYREAVTFHPGSALEPLNFLEILDCARWLGVSDPRDRIYAFLSLANLTRPLPTLRPNYAVPYIRVYHDFASEYLKMSEDLDILHFVQHDVNTLDCDFPTWIPRWDMNLYGNHTSNLNNYHRHSERITSQLSPPKATVSLDEKILELRAIIIDTVTFTAQRFDRDYTMPNDVVALWDTVSKHSNPSPYSCSPIRAFVTTFRCGIYRGRLREWQTLESAYMQLLQHELSQGDMSYENAESFHEMRMQDVHNKCFIVTGRGYYGLAPQIVQEGDLCCIVFGTRSPFIVRKTNRPHHYKLVGSVLILSRQLDHNGYSGMVGSSDSCYDWVDWGLGEEDIFLI